MAFRVSSTIVCRSNSQIGISISLSHDGSVYSLGRHSKRGHGHEEELVDIPTKIPTLKNIKSIDCGHFHSIFLDSNGSVYTLGGNSKGQLGIQKTRKQLPFTHLPQKIDIPPAKQVGAGVYFSICITEGGDVFSFGDHGYAQCGVGYEEEQFSSPQHLTSVKDIDFAACGANFVICKTMDERIIVWGNNDCGQLGMPHPDVQNAPYSPSNWVKDTIVDIKCGDSHTLVLTSTGEVYYCGFTYHRQLGVGAFPDDPLLVNPTKISSLSGIKRIECGSNHSLCIDSEGNLFCFGKNYSGQLGLLDTEPKKDPIEHPTLSDVIDVSSRGNHTFVKTSSNKIFGFGMNFFGQLSVKTNDDTQLEPIEVFQDKEYIWCSKINSTAKSARSISDRPESDNQTPKKIQKIE